MYLTVLPLVLTVFLTVLTVLPLVLRSGACADYEYCLLLLIVTMYGELKYNELIKLQKLSKQFMLDAPVCIPNWVGGHYPAADCVLVLQSYISSKHVCKFKQFTMVDSADESVHKLYQILGTNSKWLVPLPVTALHTNIICNWCRL